METAQGKLKQGEIIFRQGDAAKCMYDILSGSVGIYVNYGTANEKLLTTLGPDRFFGEMGMIDECPRSATAVAMETGTQVQVITLETFGTYFREHPGKVLMIMQQMSGRIRDLTGDYLDACRAITEAVDARPAEDTQTDTLKRKLQKFLDDYEQMSRAAAQRDAAGNLPPLYRIW